MPFRYIIANITSPILAKSGFSLCPQYVASSFSLPLLCSLRQKVPELEMTLFFTEPSDLTTQEVR